MLIQLLVILLGQIITSAIGLGHLASGLVCVRSILAPKAYEVSGKLTKN